MASKTPKVPKVLGPPMVRAVDAVVTVGTAVSMFLTTVPVKLMDEAPLMVLLSPSNVPLVIASTRVAPIVRASKSLNVPPTPLKVNGKLTVFALVVMSWVPEVAPNRIALADAVNVMPVEIVKFP